MWRRWSEHMPARGRDSMGAGDCDMHHPCPDGFLRHGLCGTNQSAHARSDGHSAGTALLPTSTTGQAASTTTNGPLGGPSGAVWCSRDGTRIGDGTRADVTERFARTGRQRWPCAGYRAPRSQPPWSTPGDQRPHRALIGCLRARFEPKDKGETGVWGLPVVGGTIRCILF